uniref:auxin response factor 16-like n=1 Tax=Erigeron canadensis TaxID=72917 RepID=UPI001CB8ED0F|nr:auxin response factor 16-like [Erigeron canadensis]XP_043615380.1 auxin response factor 16-like [Erigeron canadensis]
MMISVMNSMEKSLDSQLWHACAGGMVQMPLVYSKVFYFPQGHVEHAALGNVNFGDFPRIPPYILCQVSAIKFMADPDTDEVYVKMGLVPLKNHNDFGGSFDNDDRILGFGQNKNENQENPTSFAKTLTQSDANNGGGFSVPRYCADTIFPKLDYAADPPVQTIQAKDVHGQIWRFRHIYRGTPRRHLLTTGWSNFVNNKKLVAGDSIVFVRSDNGELCVGIRRANRGSNNGGFFGLAGENENNNQYFKNPKGKLSPESVIEAANLAANGKPFEVFYYPRASTPEFCVKASTVMAAMRIQWCPGMRFKMPFETEDSSRISWFMGTVSSVHVNDQVHWPNSPWRLLQVTWDEPDLLQNVKRVNPWLVEMVSNMPAIHLSPFSPARKKARIPQPLDFPLISSLIATNNIPTSIQGARHNSSQLETDSNQNPQIKKIPSFPLEMLNNDDPLSKISSPVIEKTKETNEKVSSLLPMGNTDLHSSLKKNDDYEKDKKRPVFVLFGQPILTEQQLSESWSGDGSVVLQNGPVQSSSDEAGPWLKEQKSDFGLEASHCKVSMDS